MKVYMRFRIVLALLLLFLYFLNEIIQGFCQPVLYARIAVLSFYFSWFALPYLERLKVKYLLLVFVGMGIPITMYCIWFLFYERDGIGVEIILPPVTVVVLIPFLLLMDLVLIFFRYKLLVERICYLSGIFLLVAAQTAIIFRLNNSFEKIREKELYFNPEPQPDEIIKDLPANYFTERYLGRHWKYHTRICYAYDGWRPPYHDPMMNIAVEFFFNTPAVFSDRGLNIQLYQKLFTERPLVEDCSCARLNSDAQGYLSADNWLKTP